MEERTTLVVDRVFDVHLRLLLQRFLLWQLVPPELLRLHLLDLSALLFIRHSHGLLVFEFAPRPLETVHVFGIVVLLPLPLVLGPGRTWRLEHGLAISVVGALKEGNRGLEAVWTGESKTNL